MICDFAEYYHIYDYKQFPITYVAKLAYGLRDNSRTKLKLADKTGTFEEMMMTMIYDAVNIIRYYHTKDAQDGVNPPEFLYSRLFDKDYKTKEDEVEYMHFSSAEDFRRAWNGE